jgi:ATP-binding protein involved in chromosome partitioning
MSLIGIKKIFQVDNYSFQIVWMDEKKSVFRLSYLQRHCPCLRCKETSSIAADEEVKATKIQNVGTYALSIAFTSGCSKGIYTFPFLRQLSVEGI